MDIEVDVDDVSAVAWFTGAAQRVTDLRFPFSQITDDFERIEQETFNTAGIRGLTLWRWPSPRWLKRKVASGHSPMPLVFTGMLMRSLTQRGAKWAIRRATATELVVGTKDPVVNPLVGSKGRRRKLDKGDDLIGVGRRDLHRWEGYISDHISGEGAARGFAGMGL